MHILRWMVLAVPLMLTVASATAQTNIVSAGQQSSLGIEVIPGATYTWDLYIDNTSINFVTTGGNCPVTDAYFVGGNTSPTVDVMWVTPGTYYFRVVVQDPKGCMNLKVGTMAVVDCPLPPVVTFSSCFDNITTLHAKPFRLKGGLPLGGVYSGPGVTGAGGVYTFTPLAAGTGIKTITYTYTNASSCSASQTLNIDVRDDAVLNCGDWMTDIRDSRTYPTISLGPQCWMAANLDYGTDIQSSQVQTDNCISEKYCYNNDPANCAGQGGLYQWDEVMQYDNTPANQGFCPPGWHVPTEAEWADLLAFYGGNAFAGRRLQENTGPGFNAIPGGVLYLNSTWSFKDFATIFWTSSPAGPVRVISHGMNNKDVSVSYYESLRSNAFPVRCLKD